MLTATSLSTLVPSDVAAGTLPEQPAGPRSRAQGPAAERVTDMVEIRRHESLFQMLCRLAADWAR